ncbi:MAG: SDR family oxidoreductase [Planctomycetes bacterium]|nr:SDR family oxidoreductase [Planctomycetota bacterium]MCB9891667.1 SDR family oxidoreductase [Planctomycetota bacterium]MCB9919227.1 SDR family oxidoreductase [Planctomycetota bacterium]
MTHDTHPGAAAAKAVQLRPVAADRGPLAGRIAIVTGGGWNIGRAVALAFARSGARVTVASRNLVHLQETCAMGLDEGFELRAFAADLEDPEQVQALFSDVEESVGPVDLLACLAGGLGATQPCAETNPREWLSVVTRNLFTTYLCCRRALPQMLSRERGDILTCAGGGAFFPMIDAHATAYASAKAAICRFTDQLYAEHRSSKGLRINCMEPGMTLSPRDLEAIEAEEARTGSPHPAREHNHSPDDGAELALFLLSPGAAALNGRILSVDEDWWRDPERVRQVAETDLYRLRRTFL